MDTKTATPVAEKPAKRKLPVIAIDKPTPTCPEDKAYIKYIDEHRNYIYGAFRRHGQQICLCLSLIGGPFYHALRNRIFKHDISKYSAEEFDAYRNTFFPKENEEKDSDRFQKAWKHHYTVNDHHWEHWVNNGKVSEMDKVAIAEMILDWEAMSVRFKNSPIDWYQSRKDSIILGKRTRELVETVLTTMRMAQEYPYTIRKNNKRAPRQKK